MVSSSCDSCADDSVPVPSRIIGGGVAGQAGLSAGS